MSKNFRETLNQQLNDPEFKTEWDQSEAEYQIIKSMLEARRGKNITQKQLTELTAACRSSGDTSENRICPGTVKRKKDVS